MFLDRVQIVRRNKKVRIGLKSISLVFDKVDNLIYSNRLKIPKYHLLKWSSGPIFMNVKWEKSIVSKSSLPMFILVNLKFSFTLDRNYLKGVQVLN